MQNVLSSITKYSIYVLVFLLPVFWLPFSFEIFEYNKQYLMFFLVSLALFCWLAKQVFFDKEITVKKSLIDYLVLGFLFLSLLSVIFSVDKNSSLFGFYGRFSNGFIGLFSLAALYFLIANVKSITVDKILNLFLGSSFLAVLTGFFSIFGVWAKLGALLPLPPFMLQKTFNPVGGSLEGLAVFLAVVTALAAGLSLSRPKIFYWVLLLASLGLLVIIDFTPAWIIVLTTSGLLMGISLAKRIFKENVNRLFVLILLMIVSATFIVWQPFTLNLPKEQVLSQPVSWQVGLESATNNVKDGLLGSGMGTFHYDFAKYKPLSFNQDWMWQIRFDRAGSYLSELLGTVGFPGVVVYLGIIALFLLVSWFSLSKESFDLPLIMVFVALVVGQLVYYQNTLLGFAFWMVLGLAAVSWRAKSPGFVQEKKISFANFPEASLVFLTLVIILGMAILSLYFYGAKYYLADANYLKALSTLGESRTQNLEKAANQNSSFPTYRTVLARAYLANILQEIQKPQKEQDSTKIQLLVSQAINQGMAATKLQPNQVANWETLGIIYREIRGVAQGATEWGIKSFEKAIELEPTNPVLYTELGRLYLAAGDKEKAKENFNTALDKKSDYVTATIQLALLLEQDNILEEALVKMENLVQNNPFNVEARFQLGRLYFNNGKTDQAIEQFQAVLILVPNHSNARYALGIAYASKGETQLAIQELEKVLELNPDNADVFQKLKDLGGR